MEEGDFWAGFSDRVEEEELGCVFRLEACQETRGSQKPVFCVGRRLSRLSLVVLFPNVSPF